MSYKLKRTRRKIKKQKKTLESKSASKGKNIGKNLEARLPKDNK